MKRYPFLLTWKIPKLFLLLTWISLGSRLNAQITCSGDACQLLPNSVQLQFLQANQAFQAQYTDKVLDSLTETAILTNLNSSMVGSGVVNRFQIGGGLTLSGQKKEDIDVVINGIVFRKLPNVGATLAPNLNLAFNLGWLVGDGPSDTVPEYYSLLHRFNVYVHGFQYNYASQDIQEVIRRQDEKINLNGNVTNYGFMIRYHLVPSYSDGIGIFEFSGISLGTGVHYLRQNLSLLYNDPNTRPITLGPAVGFWGGAPTLSYRSNVTSLPLDVRIGFRMFYLLTFFAGAGTSMNFGSSNLVFQKEGPLTLSLSEAIALNTVPPELQALAASIGGTEKTGILSVTLQGRGRAPSSLNYLLGGVEVNLAMVKLLIEGMVSRDIQSIQAGVKVIF